MYGPVFINRIESSSGGLLRLEEEPALGEDDSLVAREFVFGGQQCGQVLAERVEVGDLPRSDAEEEHDVPEPAVGGRPFMGLCLHHVEAGSLEPVSVAIEQVPEVLHPGEERAQLVPLVPSDLLRQDRSLEGQDPSDFRGLEFLMSIEYDIENGIAERKPQAATLDHGDSVRP